MIGNSRAVIMAKQTKISKSTTTKTRKRVATKPRSRGKRNSKPPVEAIPVVVPPPKPDSVVVVSELRETAEILDGLRNQREELRAWMAETGESLADLRRQRADIGDLAELKRTLEAARSEFEALHQEAESTRQALAECRTADRTIESRTVIDAMPSQDGQAAESTVGGASIPADGLLPDLGSCPAGELPVDASERLVRYLNDAWIIEKEQTDLLQTLAEAALEPELKAELEEHRILSQEQQHALRERLRALGARPSGGRSFVGTIATHVWDAIQYQGREADDPVEVLLKATSAVELEAAIYTAVFSLARAAGDEETASLAGLHLKQERDFADRLRKRMIELTLRPSTAPVA
jgi:ferritin-like metal-binding protein YciE